MFCESRNLWPDSHAPDTPSRDLMRKYIRTLESMKKLSEYEGSNGMLVHHSRCVDTPRQICRELVIMYSEIGKRIIDCSARTPGTRVPGRDRTCIGPIQSNLIIDCSESQRYGEWRVLAHRFDQIAHGLEAEIERALQKHPDGKSCMRELFNPFFLDEAKEHFESLMHQSSCFSRGVNRILVRWDSELNEPTEVAVVVARSRSRSPRDSV